VITSKLPQARLGGGDLVQPDRRQVAEQAVQRTSWSGICEGFGPGLLRRPVFSLGGHWARACGSASRRAVVFGSHLAKATSHLPRDAIREHPKEPLRSHPLSGSPSGQSLWVVTLLGYRDYVIARLAQQDCDLG